MPMWTAYSRAYWAAQDGMFHSATPFYPGKPYFLAVRSASHTLYLETEEPVHTDGTVDLARANVAIYPREHERERGYEIDDPALRAFFYPRAQDFLRGIASNGEAFSPLKES